MKELSTLDKLAPFIPYWVEVKQSISGVIYQTTGTVLTPGVYNDIYESGNHHSIKPILRPFPHLTKEILLPNGERGVPAVLVAIMALNLLNEEDYDWSVKEMKEGNREVVVKAWLKGYEDYQVDIERLWNINAYYFASDDGCIESRDVENQVQIIDFLRSCHFAVGFEEGQFIEKEN